MTADPGVLGPDRALASSLGALLEELPDVPWSTATATERDWWEKALLGPARDMLSRSGKGIRALVVERAHRLAGGPSAGVPADLPLLIELLHVGSLVIDDIEDDSRMRRGRPALHRAYGVPLALNTGNWLYFLALSLLGRVPLSADTRVTMYADLTEALLRCHEGQALDLAVSTTSASRAEVPGLVSLSTRLKTGSLMRLAALLGARSAGGSAEACGAIGTFGEELGVGLQMLDDWSGIRMDARREKGLEDIRLARLTWPWAWLVESGDDLVFAQVAKQTREARREWEAAQVLERMRSLLALTAPERIRRQLNHALQGLETALGASEETAALRGDVDAIMRAFCG